MTHERFITEKEVAELTGLSVGTLRKHRQEMRGIRYAKVGKSVRYAYSDVIGYMSSKMITPKAG
jgi:excisionase family DNA binding protein